MKPSDDKPLATPAPRPSTNRPAWVRPRLVSYGPISKLTQGVSGSRNDTGAHKT
jgi:hypothetical protein